jgi:hypothetical protein
MPMHYLALRALVTGAGPYAAISPDDAEVALNAPAERPAEPAYRDVLISDVEGYLAARLVLVGLDDWIETAPSGIAKQAARQLVQIIRGGRITVFLTSDKVRRESVFGLFALLTQAGAGGLTLEHYADIVAMAIKPAPPPIAPREQIDWPGPRIWAADVIAARAMEG